MTMLPKKQMSEEDIKLQFITPAVLCIFLLLYNLTLIIVRSYDFSWITWNLSIIKVIISAIAYYIFAVICLNLLLVVKQIFSIAEHFY